MRRSSLIIPTLLAVAAGAVVSAALAQTGSSIQLVAIDADSSGNTATSLGALNACKRTEPGQSITVDLVADAVPTDRGIIGFEVNIEYTPDIIELSAVDNEFLLAAVGEFEPFEGLSQTLPDTDGRYLISVADLQSNEAGAGNNIESGPGVLSRITFTAKAAGIATVGPLFDPPGAYPTVIDKNNETIEVTSVGKAMIAVGQDCPVPPEATPESTTLPGYLDIYPSPTQVQTPIRTPTPPRGGETGSSTPSTGGTGSPRPSTTDGPGANGTTEESDGGTSAGTVAVVAALAVGGLGLAAAGGWMLFRRRAGSGGAGG